MDGARRGGSAPAREMPAGAGMTRFFCVDSQPVTVIPAKAGTLMDGAPCGGSAPARKVPADAGMTRVFCVDSQPVTVIPAKAGT